MTDASPFLPDWISPPGETIADLLEENGWQQADLAARTGFTCKHVNKLIQGRASLTADTAQRLSTVLGSTVEFWLTREAQYRAALQRRESESDLAKQVSWLRELPVSWMVKQKWLKQAAIKSDQVSECLRFFGVASVTAWREACATPLVAFRSSKQLKDQQGAVATWLRAAELSAASIRCDAYDAHHFRDSLLTLRSLSAEPDPNVFVVALQKACAKNGVAVVFVPAPPGCPVSGATRWLTAEKALIALSLRYKSNDQLWFSFFHEAGHLLKHGKKLLFIEGLDGLDQEKEAEADRFASELLIPPQRVKCLEALKTEAAVKSFAQELGIAPGIVVGRMQHEGWLPHSHLNHLKVRYTWT
jgi:addiction module HigA family antidote